MIVHPDFAETSNRLGAILAQLDLDRADQVADRLRALDCAGEVEEPEACPLAVFVSKQWGDHAGQMFYAEYDHVDLYSDAIGDDGGPTVHYARASLPAVVTSFVRRFDADAYPDLIS
jgi:hypothetical protein